IRVGLSGEELERFDATARKAGPRDLAVCVAQRAVGATTVGGTLAVCRAVGIRVLGTGGLGGVHRGFPNPPDVSADLGELARTRALVVSAGIKSLLDVPATLEVLETLGVPVLGFRTDDLPLFYSAQGRPRGRSRNRSSDPVTLRAVAGRCAATDRGAGSPRSPQLRRVRGTPPPTAGARRHPARHRRTGRASGGSRSIPRSAR